MMIHIKKINHIGIAVKDLENSKRFWSEILGLPLTALEEVPSCKVSVAFLKTGESDIELLSPMAGNLAMERFVQEKGGGIDHLCLEVDHLEQVLEELKANGIKLIDETPRVLPGRKFAFVDPSSTDNVLLEFYELT